MNKKLSHIALTLVAILAVCFTACQPKEDALEEATLTLSEQTLSFGKEASSQTITVTTNQAKYSSFSTAEAWLTAKQEGNSLVISVVANSKPEARQGTIIVQAGSEQGSIKVTQSASDASFELEQEVYVVKREGEKVRIAFDTNSTAPEVSLAQESDASWVSIGKVSATGVDVTIAENASADGKAKAREAKINILVGSNLQEVTIKQAGHLYFLLPMVDGDLRLNSVIKRETARGNALFGAPDGLFNKDTYKFVTESPLFPVIYYTYTSIVSNKYSSTQTLCVDAKEIRDVATKQPTPDFATFMAEQGFTHARALDTENAQTWTKVEKDAATNQDKSIIKILIAFQTDGGAILTTEHAELQTQSYATFATLPLGEQSQWLNHDPAGRATADTTAVAAWEAAKNSTFNQEQSSEDIKVWFTSTDNFIERYYIFVKVNPTASKPADIVPPGDPRIGDVKRLGGIAEPQTLAYWRDSQGQAVMTNEFKALLADNGYVFLRQQAQQNGPAFDIYYNATAKRAYLIRPVAYDESGRRVIQMVVQAIDLGTTSATKLFADPKAHEEAGKRLTQALASLDIDKLFK